MATDITITLNDAKEAVLLRMTNDYNRERRATSPSWVDLTPVQFFRQWLLELVESRAADYLQKDRMGLKAAYEKATIQEQTTINGILDKYRT
jgi:hypothetical protein